MLGTRSLELPPVKPLHAEGTSASGTRWSRPRLVAVAIVAGASCGFVAYCAAISIRGCVVCAAGQSPSTVALYVATASMLATWALVSGNG